MKLRLSVIITICCALLILAAFPFFNKTSPNQNPVPQSSNEANTVSNQSPIVLNGCTADSDGLGNTDVFCPNHGVFRLSKDPPIQESQWDNVQLTINNDQYTIQYTTPTGTNQYTLVAYSGSTPLQQIFSSPSSAISQIGKSIESGNQAMGTVFEQAAQRLSVKPTPTKAELYQYALQVVNQDRKSHLLPPVALSNISSAQSRADDMLNAEYFSHWNTDGVKPYVVYTQFGGRGNVDENISVTMAYCPVSSCTPNSFDPYKQINDSEYEMINNDAGSGWGHRDNILNPYHTSVNFGIAYDNNRFYFVEHFEDNVVNWQTVNLDGSQLHLVGQMPSGYSLYQIEVFADPPPTHLTNSALDGSPPYDLGYYDQGEFAGVMLPQPAIDTHYPECSPGKAIFQTMKGNLCVNYVTYSNASTTPQGIDVTVDVSKWMGSGLHTIYVTLKDQNDIRVDTLSATLEYLK